MRSPLVLLGAALAGLVAAYVSFRDQVTSAPRGSDTSGGANHARQAGTHAISTSDADTEQALTLPDVLASKGGRLRREHDLYLDIQRLEARDFEW
ncbi:MAG: hypothetical protein M3463_22435 [Verrucomicrobiota bacterium]|nr:hypothetical protein [Verrucomicrobiota bacterium]